MQQRCDQLQQEAVRAKVEAEAKMQAEALAMAEELLHEQAAASGKAMAQVQQRCDQMQQELDKVVRGKVEAEAKVQAGALAIAEKADQAVMLRSKLDEQPTVSGKALDELRHCCDQLLQELDEAVRAKAEVEAKAQAKAEAMIEVEMAEVQQKLEVERTRSTELQRLLANEEAFCVCASCGQLQEQVLQLEVNTEELKSKVSLQLI